jgi:hypothetical protein
MTLSVAQTIYRSMRGLTNNKLEETWREVVVVYFNVLSRQLPGGTEENHGNLCQDSQSPGRDLNPVRPA